MTSPNDFAGGDHTSYDAYTAAVPPAPSSADRGQGRTDAQGQPARSAEPLSSGRGHWTSDDQRVGARPEDPCSVGESHACPDAHGAIAPPTEPSSADGGQDVLDVQHQGAPSADPFRDDGGQKCSDVQKSTAPAIAKLIDKIAEKERIHRQLLRAEIRLNLQIQAIERGTAEAVKKLGSDSDPERAAFFTTETLAIAMSVIRKSRLPIRREIQKLAKQLPVHAWQKSVPGFGEFGLGQIVGEAGDLSRYANPAKLWKRMGLAVIYGERQRRVKGDEALEHGYVAERRAVMWTLGGPLIKAKSPGYYDFYLAVKARWKEKHPEKEFSHTDSKGKPVYKYTPKHIDNHAKRVMEKKLLKDLWRAWRGHCTADAH